MPPAPKPCQATAEFLYDDQQGCKASIPTRGCSGACESTYHPVTDTSICTCCKPREFSMQEVEMICDNPQHNYSKTMKIVKSCECQAPPA